MPKVKIDASFALTARCPTGKRKECYWCNTVLGLVMEVRSTGGKTFYFRFQDQHGSQRQIKICAYGDLTMDRIRKEAQRLRAEVVLGGDPAGDKAEKKAVPTYAELAKQHLANAETYQRSYSTTEMYMRCHILPRWGKLRLSEIRHPDVAKWLAEKRAEGLAPATVEKIRVIFGRSFELASRWNIPGCDKNPARNIPRPPINNARERSLTPQEVERLRKATEASRNPLLAPIVGMALYTGARLTELLSAKWQHVDLDRSTWLIPTSKTGKARHVPLSQAAIALISTLPKGKGEWLFPSPKDKTKRLTTIKHSWQKARDEAKLSDLHFHDLRHASASFLINSGVDLFTVGRILGHSDHKSTMRYAHLANDTLLAAAEAGAAKMNTNWAGAA